MNKIVLFITILVNLLDFQKIHSVDRDTRPDVPFSGKSERPMVRDVEKWIQRDTTFFTTFRNLRFSGYLFENTLYFKGKKNGKEAVYRSLNKQVYRDSCRYMQIVKEYENRNFYSGKGKHEFQTAKLYDSLFYTHSIVCYEPRNIPMIPPGKKSRLAHLTDQLKILIFNPGSPTDVPYFGPKTHIFGDEYRRYYDFSLNSCTYKGQKGCLVFEAIPKKGLDLKAENKLAVKRLKTVFDPANRQVLQRTYHVSMKSWLFDCDIRMQVETQKIGKKYYPESIRYSGFWEVAGMNREEGHFTIRFFDLES